MAAVEENGDSALTKAQMDRRWGGGGREEHGEATNELADAFLRWRVSMSSSESRRLLLRSYRRAEEMEMGLVSWWTGALGELKS